MRKRAVEPTPEGAVGYLLDLITLWGFGRYAYSSFILAVVALAKGMLARSHNCVGHHVAQKLHYKKLSANNYCLGRAYLVGVCGVAKKICFRLLDTGG